jgi:hypothetical protein
VYGLIFENHSEDTLRCPHKDYSSLNRWQANRDLLLAIYFSVMTNLRQGKKVSILMSSAVDSDHVASRRGLLEAVPIVQ